MPHSKPWLETAARRHVLRTADPLGHLGNHPHFGRYGRLQHTRNRPSPRTPRVSQWCDRGSLRDAVRAGAFHQQVAGTEVLGVDLPAILQALLDVERGVEHVHSLGLLHCDIKVRGGGAAAAAASASAAAAAAAAAAVAAAAAAVLLPACLQRMRLGFV